ncbi:hypothetical protein IFM89_000303 [Coptis chinensis]|uniref:Uncharacterized protein n=1 Tax=Coptis chinensis TaxID=261450 RepID=A0A835H818_9MAGN|nr:hypothetical protein IFM89_000303 [Coptis chinensis]
MPTRHLPPTTPLPAEDMAGETRPLTEAEPPLSSRHYHPLLGHSNSITSLISLMGNCLLLEVLMGLFKYGTHILCAGPSDGVEDTQCRLYGPSKAGSYPYHPEAITCLTISYDSNLAITGSENSSVHIVHIATGKGQIAKSHSCDLGQVPQVKYF